ncbi:MAG: 2-hydroxyglutaryl-CoA dehydratase [Ruminococcaceae bacterium]|nr:2-hydroxyglutaryl-CoA dehydratase [Oscillospiraceae bacterium]
MQDRSFVPFTEEMKKDYTILVPNMLPIHFKLLISLFRANGYNVELLETNGPQIAETGLKYTHNDTCYPAILVVGQMMDALLSGKYDLDKTALIMFQTGGGCRASNYISLIRKALKKADMEHVPVISLNFYGMENHPGFKLTPKILHSMVYAVCYGDLIMSLVNQVRPYETNKGEAEALADRWTEKLGQELANEKIRYRKVKENYKAIIADFAKIPMVKTYRPKVGIVGEIFVKYSPLANNDLERFLIKEGAEVVVPGLIDFCLYCIYNSIMDYKLYGKNKKTYLIWKFAFWLFTKKKNDISALIKEEGTFDGWTEFDKIIDIAASVISLAVKMGEGWLLTSEMVELAESGCANIVCTQPFGCLPNHICGKGMMKPLKEILPDINIVAIDYDAGASRVNQENRLKLMLANAGRIAGKDAESFPSSEKDFTAV